MEVSLPQDLPAFLVRYRFLACSFYSKAGPKESGGWTNVVQEAQETATSDGDGTIDSLAYRSWK
jgi:hypothetical protein